MRAPLLSALLLAGPGAAHAMTLVHQTPLDLEGSRVEGLRRLPFEKGLLEGAGTLESPAIAAETPFDDLVASWGAEIPTGAFLELGVQVRVGGKWSGWYRMGRWEAGAPRSFGRQENAFGHVNVDTLRLARKADAFRYRVEMGPRGKKPRLLRVSVAYDDSAAPLPPAEPFAPGPWVRELAVPPRSQMTEQAKHKRDICSPTSLSMLLEFWGVKKTTLEVAQLVQDQEEKIYGNWPLNVAAAGTLGLPGTVARLRGFAELQDEIAAGRPVAVSIAFEEGELRGAPIRRTRGHLFVVIGFTAEGDVVVNDPAAPDRASVRRVYPRADFERAWLVRKRGLAYLVGPRLPVELAAALPTADLRRKPREPKAPDPMDPIRASQLLYGEPVCALEARGDWLRVRAPLQPDRACAKDREEGYEGWVRADALRTPAAPYRPDALVRAKRAELSREGSASDTLTVPLGSLLVRASSAPARVRLLDGGVARVESAVLGTAAPAVPDRREVLETAALFLGDRYVWGGRSSQQSRAGWGVDCSGLVQLAYRSAGMIVPRDAQAQRLRARPIRRAELAPGDPVFLTDPRDAERVNHVMLYTGGDGLLESREAAGKALRTTFAERFGRPLAELESGDWVLDPLRPKERKRKLLFGSFVAP